MAKDVLIRFLSMEPIENLVTAMHWHFDKVIFICYDDYLAVRKKDTESFLLKYCDVSRVEFHVVSRKDLKGILKKIREETEEERKYDNRIFLDLTGGKGQVMAAFGMLSEALELPMHLYWLTEDRLIEYCEDEGRRMSSLVTPQAVELDLDRYIEMRGGIINYRMHKEIKGIDDDATRKVVDAIWAMFEAYEEGWSTMSGLFQKLLKTDSLSVSLDRGDVRDLLKRSQVFPEERFEAFLQEGEDRGIFRNLTLTRRELSFRFLSRTVRNILMDAGSILELHTYEVLRALTPNCKVGVHLDWDGVIHTSAGYDVVNEIDVLALHGLIPAFISCKIGTADKNALYELAAVSERFGGKYAQKLLVTAKGMSETDLLRAQEMEISVVDRNLKPLTASQKPVDKP